MKKIVLSILLTITALSPLVFAASDFNEKTLTPSITDDSQDNQKFNCSGRCQSSPDENCSRRRRPYQSQTNCRQEYKLNSNCNRECNQNSN